MIGLNMSSLFLKNANIIDVSTGNISLQNIRIENGIIQEIWKNQDFQNLRKNLINNDRENLPELCKDCTYPKKGQWSLPFFWEKSL